MAGRGRFVRAPSPMLCNMRNMHYLGKLTTVRHTRLATSLPVQCPCFRNTKLDPLRPRSPVFSSMCEGSITRGMAKVDRRLYAEYMPALNRTLYGCDLMESIALRYRF